MLLKYLNYAKLTSAIRFKLNFKRKNVFNTNLKRIELLQLFFFMKKTHLLN